MQHDTGEITAALISSSLNDGYVAMLLDNTEGFIPHYESFRDLTAVQLIGTFQPVLILDSETRPLSLSLRRAHNPIAWNKLLTQQDCLLKAKVLKITDFGLIVQVSGIVGFIPLAHFLGDPSPDDEVMTKILEISPDKHLLVLSQTNAAKDERSVERNADLKQLAVGQIVGAEVIRLRDFAAFVDLGSALEAMIPCAEISTKHIRHPSDVLSVGQFVTGRIIRIDYENSKILMSLLDINYQGQPLFSLVAEGAAQKQ